LRCGLFSSLIKTLVDEVGVGVKDIPANLPGQKTWINCAQYNGNSDRGNIVAVTCSSKRPLVLRHRPISNRLGVLIPGSPLDQAFR
jgi:hypothetical protein